MLEHLLGVANGRNAFKKNKGATPDTRGDFARLLQFGAPIKEQQK